MSLLIKALATAEKDKQAELKKKQAIESATDVASPLALEPISAKGAGVPGETALALAADEISAAEKSELSLAADESNNEDSSLLEESGLAIPQPDSGKYVKSNPVGNKPAGNVTSKVEDTISKNKADTFKAAAVASVANVKLQSELAKDTSQKVAANVFVANQPVKNSSSKSALILLGVAGALMIWLGLQGYQYIQKLTAPEVVIVKPAPPAPQIIDNTAAANIPEPTVLQPGEQVVSANQIAAIATTEVQARNAEETSKIEDAKATKSSVAETSFLANDSAFAVEGDATKKSSKKQLKNSRDAGTEYGDAQYQNPKSTAQNPPLKLFSRTPIAGVDPTLLAAYQAFSRGDDVAAQQQYRQVLQGDVRNVDALLGMAAIAQRQGRDADATGWYQKVLEIEPRNTIAQSAITSVQMNAASSNLAATDLVGAESRIKNMLAQQPEAANLHAALGNLFAAQNQWASAQEAYFNASRFAPNNADYVFNLAVSLDQLGKPSLALAQYRHALDLLNNSGAASPDRAQLEARIQALEASK